MLDKMNKYISYPFIIIMKVGGYCGYSLDEIIKIKKKEEKENGAFFWGYGGVFCRPKVINAFVFQATAKSSRPKVLFTITTSDYQSDQMGRFSKYSSDQNEWKPLPESVLLVGNTKKPHFAIVASKLRKVEKYLNLNHYNKIAGFFVDPQKYLGSYFRYRVDKACGVFNPNNEMDDSEIEIFYESELVEPNCVYIK